MKLQTPEIVLWAVRRGNADWQEELITSTRDKEKLAKAREWATANGFGRFRESAFNGEKPEFARTLKV